MYNLATPKEIENNEDYDGKTINIITLLCTRTICIVEAQSTHT